MSVLEPSTSALAFTELFFREFSCIFRTFSTPSTAAISACHRRVSSPLSATKLVRSWLPRCQLLTYTVTTSGAVRWHYHWFPPPSPPFVPIFNAGKSPPTRLTTLIASPLGDLSFETSPNLCHGHDCRQQLHLHRHFPHFSVVFWQVARRTPLTNTPDGFPLSRPKFWDHNRPQPWPWSTPVMSPYPVVISPTSWLFFGWIVAELRQWSPQSPPPHCPLSIMTGDNPSMTSSAIFDNGHR